MSEALHGALHLIPVPLGEAAPSAVLTPETLAVVAALDYFIVENEKSARLFLKNAGHPRALRELTVTRFDKRSSEADARALLQPLLTGRSAGLLSEAGCPAIADPGALVVAAAHGLGLQVNPHVGPSALLLALMASGFNGQRFAFHGYLPVGQADCSRKIKELEQASRATDMTQIFIETPYRNQKMLEALLASCDPDTRLCVAGALTLPGQTIRSATVAEWKRLGRDPSREPAVFLLYAAGAQRSEPAQSITATKHRPTRKP